MTTTATTTEAGTEMTDASQTTITAPDGTTAPEGTVEGQESDAAALQAENFKQREKRRETEAERDKLAATVAALQRAEVEKLAATTGKRVLANAPDLWLAGVKHEDLLAEDGTVDPAKVRAAVEGVLAERPHWGTENLARVRAPRDTGAGRREVVGSGGSRAEVMAKVVKARRR